MRAHISLLFCLGALLIALSSTFAAPANPNPGPRSAEEAAFLFEEGSKALQSQNHAQAIRSLRRLVERYPSDAKIEESYLGLLSALSETRAFSDLAKFARELILRKPPAETENRARAHLARAELELRNFLKARTLAGELLERNPTLEQKALARSIRFQSLLEDKQYREARAELDLLRELVEKNALDAYQKRIPDFKMSLATRVCLVSHLVKDTPHEESEILEYFGSKNLCFKSALPEAQQVHDSRVVADWCESFDFLEGELRGLKTDSFLKQKIRGELDATLALAKGIQPDLVKCHADHPAKKSEKRNRKSRRPAPQGH